MSSQIKLEEKDLAKLTDKMKKLEMLDKAGFERSLADFATLTSRDMKKIAPYDTKNLRRLITAKSSKRNAIVESKADYSGYVEHGKGKPKKANTEIPFFYPTINRRINVLLMDINNKIKKALR